MDLNQEFGSVPPPPREDDIDRQPEHVAEVIDGMPRGDPPPELVEAVVRHYVDMRTSLVSRVATIEAILGFIREDGDTRALAVRVAKLEAFLGIKG